MQVERVKRTPNVSFLSSPGVDFPAPSDPPVDLRRMLVAGRRNAALMAAIVVLVTGVIVAVSVTSPERFQARARIAGDPASQAAVDSAAVDRSLALSQVLLTSQSVLGAAAHRLSGETADSLAAKVSASVDSTAATVDVFATDESPVQAARIANTVAGTFLDSRAAAERRAAQGARAKLQAELAAMPAGDRAGALGDAVRQQISNLAVAAVTAGSSMSLAEQATVPTAPYAPRPLRNGLLAAIAGLLLAAMAAVVRERLRGDRVDASALAHAANRPLLAVLSDGREKRAWRRLWGVVADRWRRRAAPAPDGPVDIAEAALQGSVKAALPPNRSRTVAVCGATAGDTPGRVAYALARALAWAGSSAMVLDCRPAGYASDDDLEGARAAGHDYVILEMPPVNESPDLPLVSWQLDGAILVAAMGRASAADVAVAAQLLNALEVHVLGVVVTAPADVLPSQLVGSFEPAARPPARSRSRRGASRPRAARELPVPPAAAPAPADPVPELPLAASAATSLWMSPVAPDDVGGGRQTRS
jgi:capsular polysaccharide biosynthesis protein